MERKLAHIEEIKNIRPIEGADNIELAEVLGWECVVAKKDNFKVGDAVIYIEIDSIVPDRPEFEFLRDRKFRVRTIKLRGQISQGLVLPVSYLNNSKIATWYFGMDVTDILGIKKYDPQGDLERKLLEEKTQRSKNKVVKFFGKYNWFRKLFSFLLPKKNKFPSFIKKTDEERIQNIPEVLKDQESLYQVTEKIDGQSATYFLVKNPKKFLWFDGGYTFGVCSRNLYLTREDNSNWWKVAKKFNLKELLTKIKDITAFDLIIFQGEIIGPNIQGNKYGVNDVDFYLFNVIADGHFFPPYEVASIAEAYGLKSVPYLGKWKLFSTPQAFVEFSKGESKLAKIHREGIVVRNVEKGISFKVINPDFLLKYKED